MVRALNIILRTTARTSPPYLWIENGKATCDPVWIEKSSFKCVGNKGWFHGSGPGEEGWDIEAIIPTFTEKAVNYI